MDEVEVLKAVPFSEEGICGEDMESPVAALMPDATRESTLEELLELWARLVAAADHGAALNLDGTVTLEDDNGPRTLGGGELIEYLTNEENEHGHLRPAGFWLLTEESVRTVMLLDKVPVWGDYEGHVVLRAMRVLAHELAVAVVGDRSRLTEGYAPDAEEG